MKFHFHLWWSVHPQPYFNSTMTKVQRKDPKRRETLLINEFPYFIRNVFMAMKKIPILNANPVQNQYISKTIILDLTAIKKLHPWEHSRIAQRNIGRKHPEKQMRERVLWNQNKFLSYLKQSTWTIYTWAYSLGGMINGKMLTKITPFLDWNLSRWKISFKTRVEDFSCAVTPYVHQLINLRAGHTLRFRLIMWGCHCDGRQAPHQLC